ncbi:MAG: PASTA domain-containing protein [Breznakibacter sp.]|nr:PASTA domain-containing protein [Breznakibacter sp.]
MDIKKDMIWRIGLIYVLAVAGGLLIIARIIYLQAFESEIWAGQGNSQKSRSPIVHAKRGNILSSDGKPLACSVTSYKIYMDTKAGGLKDEVFYGKIDSLAIQLSRVFGDKSAAAYKSSLVRARERGDRYYLVSPVRVNYHDYARIKEFPIFRLGANKGGFMPEKIEHRKLPFGSLASRTIGKIYGDDRSGIGLELTYDDILRGEAGECSWRRIDGRWVAEETIAPERGYHVVSTIDTDIQDIAETALKRSLIDNEAENGVVIIMDVETGYVRAISNLHRSSPGIYLEDNFNFAIGAATEPGSTFKLASLMAALEDGLISLTDKVDTKDGTYKFYDAVMRDSHEGGYGKITIQQAFEYSSNVGISRVIFDKYNSSPRRFVDRISSFGLRDPLGIEIQGERAPMIKYPGGDDWSGISLPWMSIGYEVKITPLQTLAFYNAIANNGRLMKPIFVEKFIDDDGIVQKEFGPITLNRAIASRETIKMAHQLCEGVVERGTASNIKSSRFKIAGKTGTAQIARGKEGYKDKDQRKSYQASFAGYFPAQNPKFSGIVMVYDPKSGAYSGNLLSATVFREIADKIYATKTPRDKGKDAKEPKGNMPEVKGGLYDDVETALDELDIDYREGKVDGDYVGTNSRSNIVDVVERDLKKGLVPNVKGWGAKDAVALLENAGMVVFIQGRGMVVSQSLNPGQKIIRGSKIVLRLS